MRSSRLFAAAILMGLGTPVASAQSPTWSPAQDVGPSGVNETALGLVFGSGGTALVATRFQITPADPSGHGRLAVRPPDGTIARIETLGDDLAAAPVAYGADRVALLRRRAMPVARNALDQRVRLRVSRGTITDPSSGRAVPVATFRATPNSPVALAASRRGEIAVAWTQLGTGEERSFVVRTATGSPGRPFGRPRTLGRVHSFTPPAVALAYDDRDALVIAYSSERRGRRVLAKVVRAAHGFGRERILGPRDGFESIAVAAAGHHHVVAWGTRDAGIEASRPWVVRAAADDGATRVLDSGGPILVDVESKLAALITRTGRATVVWSHPGGDTGALKIATSDARGRFGAAAEFGTGGLGGLVWLADGTMLLTWSDRTTHTVYAAMRPPGAEFFGGLEIVAEGEQLAGDGAHAAFDPRTGAPAILWTAGGTPGAAVPRLSVRAGA